MKSAGDEPVFFFNKTKLCTGTREMKQNTKKEALRPRIPLLVILLSLYLYNFNWIQISATAFDENYRPEVLSSAHFCLAMFQLLIIRKIYTNISR